METKSRSLGNSWRALLLLFWSPIEAVKCIRIETPILLPLSIVGVGSVVVQTLNLPFIMHVSERNIPADLSQAQIEQTLQLLRQIQYWGIALSPVTILLKWAFVAGLVFLAAQLLDGLMSFRQSFSLVAFASFLLFLETCLVTIILRGRGLERMQDAFDLQPAIGLNLIFSDAGFVWSSLLNRINPMQIWYLVLLILGIATMNRFSYKKSAIVVIPIWFSLVSTQIAIASIGLMLK